MTYGTNSVGPTRYRVQAASSAGTLTSAEFTVDRLASLTVQPVTGVSVGVTKIKATYQGKESSDRALVVK